LSQMLMLLRLPIHDGYGLVDENVDSIDSATVSIRLILHKPPRFVDQPSRTTDSSKSHASTIIDHSGAVRS